MRPILNTHRLRAVRVYSVISSAYALMVLFWVVSLTYPNCCCCDITVVVILCGNLD